MRRAADRRHGAGRARGRETAIGHQVRLSFANPPQVRQRIDAGASFDVAIAPPAVLDESAKAAKIVATPGRFHGAAKTGDKK